MHLLLTRPAAGPDDDPFHAALLAAGHRVLSAPLLAVVPTGARPSFDGVQGLIVTSRNALKVLAAQEMPDAAFALPLFAVGPSTAAYARALGFRYVMEGPGTGQALAETVRQTVIPAAGPLLHLAGETLAFDLKGALEESGFSVRVETVYRTEPATELPEAAASALRAGTLDGVVLMSPRTAKVYASLAESTGLLRHDPAPLLFCLSEAVARELGPPAGVRIAVAAAPNSQEMLALIAREAPDSP
jgi:uroporphyrinogen-III synthase